MEAPDKIYVPQHNIEAGNIQELDELIVAGSTEYIRKDALLEWAKERYKAIENDNQLGNLFKQGVLYELHRVIAKINTM